MSLSLPKQLAPLMWIPTYLLSSIGKKQVLGVAGAGLVGFLLGHMSGNFALLNPDAAAAQAHYNAYAHFLMSLKPFLYVIELGLVAIMAVHAGMALKLKLENRRARGNVRYAVSKSLGDKPFASATMFISGLTILVFLIQHLLFIKYGHEYLYRDANGVVMRDMWLTMVLTFANPWWTAFYAAVMLVLGGHLIHAIPSLFRTFGIVHRKWNLIIETAGVLLGAAIAFGFAVTAIGTCLLVNLPAGKEQIQKSLDAQKELTAPCAIVLTSQEASK